MRFALFKGLGQYGSVRLHIDQLAQALRDIGEEAVIADLGGPNAQAELTAVLTNPADVYFGISGTGVDIKADGKSVFDILDRPYVTLSVDHPLHHLGRLQTEIRKKHAFFLDRTHVQFMAAWPPAREFAQVGFLPPGANELPEPPDLSDEAFAARDIPILFTGTYRGEPKRPWDSWPDSPARTIAKAVGDRLAADGQLPVLDALRGVLKALGVELTPQLFIDLAGLIQPTQAFAEAYHRDALLHTLGRAGAPLQIWGSGWEPMIQRYPSFQWGGIGSFEETLHLLRRARIVLNVNNGFVAGGHERVFTAMCGGAAVFSDNSRYYAEAFKEGRDLVTFSWSRLADAPNRLLGMLADEGRLAAIARAGAARAQAEHRWTNRAEKLVSALRQAP